MWDVAIAADEPGSRPVATLVSVVSQDVRHTKRHSRRGSVAMTVIADEGLLSRANRRAGGRRGAEIHASEQRAQKLEDSGLAVRVDTAKMGKAQRALLLYLYAETLAAEQRASTESWPELDMVEIAEAFEVAREATEQFRPPLELQAAIARFADLSDSLVRPGWHDQLAATVAKMQEMLPDRRAPQPAVRLTRVDWSSKAATDAIGWQFSPSAASQALRHLERRGLLFRDAGGGRTTAVQLTMAGRRVAASLCTKP